MPLSPGDKLGPYEVLSPIGAGGMGEVDKARDTRLDRTVAVKVLPDHIAKGPIALDQALKLATQIADALDRAHRAGVTHRDVNPQNIMVTRDGIKVLDFGLAKAINERHTQSGPDSPTLTRRATEADLISAPPATYRPSKPPERTSTAAPISGRSASCEDNADGDALPKQLTFLVNFFDELRRKAPAGK